MSGCVCIYMDLYGFTYINKILAFVNGLISEVAVGLLAALMIYYSNIINLYFQLTFNVPGEKVSGSFHGNSLWKMVNI